MDALQVSEIMSLTVSQNEDLGLAARWCTLRAGAARRGGARRLRREVAALRASVLAPDQPATAPHTRAHLHRRIDQLKDRLSSLLEYKVSMLKLNVSAQRLVADASPESGAGGESAEVTEAVVRALRDEVAELYRAWEDAHQRTSSELISLEGVLEAWSSWESGLKELQGALKGDQATLRLIESALLAGQAEQVAPHVRDVAKLLSEKTHQTGSVCGSVSDSGISDSGSERGASERERRLAALRAAARTLQASLAPGSRALQAMAERMEAAESELRALQGTCRSLLQRTAAPTLHTQSKSEDPAVLSKQKTSPDEPEVDPSGRTSRSKWAWRVLKSALPFQLCLLAFLCAAYLLDHPRCCDAVNNLSMSFTPQLRYVRGPPPV